MSTINNNFNNVLNELSLGAPQTESTKKKDELGQDEFLELMINQLKNQDPFAPMENGDFIAQMAQFSNVTGLAELQQSFDKLATSLQSNQALQASTLVGRKVMVPSQVVSLPEGGSASGAIDLPTSSESVSLMVQDGSGQVIRHLGLGSQSAGEVYFNWDGLNDNGQSAAAGRYYISATGGFGNETVALDTLVIASVESVTLDKGGNGLTLNLADGNAVDISSIREIQ